ncbi:BMP family ABC transporter substrate-binding protein, partial [uncultured Methylobacterium sp.]|uniref:BMP family ABC transporter substrate-binding protein n=1 Tax=uncultured Methylobacterium sp. TaxID=157278 RepID=UPI0035CAAFD7
MNKFGSAVLGAFLTALGPAHAADRLKVGFVYVGPVADFGYSYQHDLSRKALAEALGDRVETTFLESVPEADSERSIEKLARSGMGLVFTTSFGFMEPTLKVAKKF